MMPVDTRSAPATPRSETRIEPQLARVSVLGGNTQLDVALPATIPIAGLIGDLLAHIESRNPRQHSPDDPDGDPDDGPHDRQHRWTLALVGGDRLPPNRSLAESGVRDGDLLLLTSADAATPPVLFDDVVDAVARLNESAFASWSPVAARRMGFALAIAAAVVSAVGLAAYRLSDPARWVAALPGGLSLGLLVASTILARHYRAATVATVLAMAAMPPAFVTGMLAVPGPFGAAHLTLASTTTLLLAVLSYRLTAVGPAPHAAVTSASIGGAIACGTCLLTEFSVGDVAAVTAAAGVLTLLGAARLTILLAKLPLPPVPTAGAPVDAEDIEPRPAIEGIGAIGAMALPKADALTQRSQVANDYLTGITAGCAGVIAISAILTTLPVSEFDVKTTLFAAIIALVLCLRGRSHSDLYQACVLIGFGASTLLILVGSLSFGGGHRPIIAFGLAAGIIGAAMLFGVFAPATEFSPVMRRWAEIVEYLLVSSIIPLLLWILDLYRMIGEL
ncbi:type VII secretion integral membrane protein EccD [Gordonia sp. ABSL1-1]|uniref:type VII secretion integral membrane protein EccD n=1 Tax=Gordonia sp. ABSL1-1 TaxID=3053923 RepID=UPI0025734B4C|nr:type VII secretion integral membrane protein EccD [Gordonia sp. ABSL1-1]MDL9938332.1 type VII secretion integral membrane protein EccD [Gordonia sp. ABSL1-1]